MRVSVLGPLEVLDDSGVPVDVGGRQPRLMLSALVAAAPRSVAMDTIVDVIWGEAPPASAAGTVQSYVSRLRGRLGAATLRFDDVGYRLDLPVDRFDHLAFERLADEGRALLDAGRPQEARVVLLDALSLWRGPAFGDFADRPVLLGPANRLEDRRLSATEDRMAAELDLGRHAAVTSELSELAAAHPLRERLQGQLALALYRSGRQADALRALDRAGRLLREELGIEPGRELRDLEGAILRHDPSLDLAGPAAPTATASSAPASTAPGEPAAGASSTAAPGAAAGLPPLVGRDAERALLERAVAESGLDARFVVIEGEPGIGKTRLAEEAIVLARRAGGWGVWGRSDEGGAAPALWPWLPPLRALADHGIAVPDVLRELLSAEAPTETRQARSLQFERFEAFAELLGVAGASAPVVVCLDDLQWADTTSLELLGHLAGRLGRGVVVVATVRQLEVGRNDAVTDALAAIAHRPGSRRIALRGLEPEATGQVLALAAGRVVTEAEAAAIHDRAEGNPFYAIELVRLLQEEGGHDGEVPGSVGDVIRRRLARLPAPTVELLGVAAVVGRDVDLALLARAAGVELVEALDAVEPAVVHRLLLDPGGRPGVLRFSHALVREVLLDDLTSLRRARLHLAVADAIEAGGAGIDEAEILAEHLWRAVPVGVARRAADALEQAAEVAVRRLAYSRAEDLLDRAVQLRRAAGTSLADRTEELHALIRMLEVSRAVRYFQGAPRAAIARARELAELTGEAARLVDVLWFECASQFTAARFEQGEPSARALLAVGEHHPDPAIRSTAVQNMAVLAWGQGRIAESAAGLDLAQELLAQVTTPDDPFRAERRLVAMTFWLFMHAAVGDMELDDVWERFDGLYVAVADPVARSSVCGFAATTALAMHAWDRAEHFVALGASADPNAQFGFWRGQLLMVGAVVRARHGEVAEAVAQFDEGRRTYLDLDAGSALAAFEASLALALAEQGHGAEAATAAAAARATLDRLRERWCEPFVLMAEAAVAVVEGRRDDAERHREAAVALAREQGAARTAALIGEALDRLCAG